MNLLNDLTARAESKCEFCGITENLSVIDITPNTDGSLENSALACNICSAQIETPANADTNHWHCLNDCMWSQVPAVQVVSWRMLNHLKSESWANDLLEMMYLDDETLSWAQAGMVESSDDAEDIKHMDSNGSLLSAGDTVVLIKDLNVKGAGFTAKRGTAVRNISLVFDNPKHIEGRVNGQQIVILTEFVKKNT